MIPIFIGRIVTLVTVDQARDAVRRSLADAARHGAAAAVRAARPRSRRRTCSPTRRSPPTSSNRIRWQNHWHVVRQSWAFFQNDFAGRIANRVMQTGPAIRETIVALITGVWYILVYGTSAVHPARDRRAPGSRCRSRSGSAAICVLLRVFVPRMRDRSKEMSEARSMLIGRIVDSYTNILTVKLFARAREEDAYVREALEQHTGRFHRSLRLNTLFSFCLSTLNATMVTGTAGIAMLLWTQGRGRGRHRRDGAAAHLADRQRGRLGRLSDHRDLREHRRGAGRHDDDRAADRADRRARRRGARGDARRDRLRGRALRLRPRAVVDEDGHARLRGDRRPDPHGEAGREGRPGRPLRRRQVDAGQPAAALLRPRGRPHPDRRPGHRAASRRRACARRSPW